MAAGFVTIGHSNRPPAEVIAMLREAQVGLLVDVRRFPRSRANPGFNIDSFPDELARHQIGYRHLAALGGRRPRQTVDPAVNALWRVQSFHNYADYTLGPDFRAALAELLELGARQRLALMCSEAVWWRCHRRIITDYLLAAGHPVTHLMGPGQAEPARMTPGAVAGADGRVTYPVPAPDLAAAPAGD